VLPQGGRIDTRGHRPWSGARAITAARAAGTLRRLPRGLVFALTLAVALVAVLWPPALPIAARRDTLTAWRLGQAVRPGQAVFLWIDFGFGAQEELDPMLRAVLRQLMRRRAVLCLAARTLEGSQIAESAMDEAAADHPAYRDGYGRTWVNLGFRPAPDIVLRAATANLPAAYNGVDWHGTPLAQLPVARRLRALRPGVFRLAYVFDWGDGYQAMMTYVAQVTGLPFVVGAITMEAPVIQPYVATGQIAAVIPGIRGAAEYEHLLGRPGEGSRLQEGSVVTAAFVTLLLLAGNLGDWLGPAATPDGPAPLDDGAEPSWVEPTPPDTGT
jgi:hypothetical protein